MGVECSGQAPGDDPSAASARKSHMGWSKELSALSDSWLLRLHASDENKRTPLLSCQGGTPMKMMQLCTGLMCLSTALLAQTKSTAPGPQNSRNGIVDVKAADLMKSSIHDDWPMY